MGYTKLFSEIIMSTVWREPDHVRITWITMLALRDGKHMVQASLPGLADAARVTMEQCIDALDRLSSPDPYSRTTDNEGRRIKKVDGGWLILNGEKYRNKLSLDERRAYQRIKQREYRAKKAEEKQGLSMSRLQNGQQFTQKETRERVIVNNNSMSGKPDDPQLNRNSELTKQAKEVLQFLNKKTGRNYHEVDANIRLIKARLKESSLQECKQVVAKKCRDWGNNEKMEKYLRPATLFNASKFAQYQGELGGSHEA